MWLPTPIYERIPQFWLLLGLLFMSSGVYLGFEYTLSFGYFGVGFLCCLWSLKIVVMRQRHRQEMQALADRAAEAEQKAREEPQHEGEVTSQEVPAQEAPAQG